VKKKEIKFKAIVPKEKPNQFKVKKPTTSSKPLLSSIGLMEQVKDQSKKKDKLEREACLTSIDRNRAIENSKTRMELQAHRMVSVAFNSTGSDSVRRCRLEFIPLSLPFPSLHFLSLLFCLCVRVFLCSFVFLNVVVVEIPILPLCDKEMSHRFLSLLRAMDFHKLELVSMFLVSMMNLN